MTAPLEDVVRPRWSGLDLDFHQALMEEGQTPNGEALRMKAQDRFHFAEGKPFLLGPAQMVTAEYSQRFRQVTATYHRAIQAIVDASYEDEAVRRALSTPPDLAADLAADLDPANAKVHICRLDLMLDPDGGFWILETNANCPGGFVFSGICNRAWREFMEERGYPMPPALDHEEKGFMAKWFLEVIEADTGTRPDYIALLREEGGNRLELGDFAKHVRWEGIECDEIDPRQIHYDGVGTGPPTVDGRPVTHAYQKLGMQPFRKHRKNLDCFVHAVRDRALFVQNGQRGRWVGDDKLCLAIISDPDFRYLFDPDDYAELQKHVPWSRNLRLVPSDILEEVSRDRDRFVLKKGLDTRGRGVVVGAGVTEEDWDEAVRRGVADGWLVQEFHPTCWVERDFDAPALQRHDLALGAINGRLTTLFMRSSGELRVNMARTGRMHPVFMAADPASPS
ncbi:MAG: hypothetical protein KJO65_10970 [Gemmatimonadetes bacterium]|nr:hypothetical protein [Gemmatimonadota bacterium]